MKFIYQARNKEGKIESGSIEASDKEAAAVLLQKYNYVVISLKEEVRPAGYLQIIFKERISKKDLAIFARQLAVMIDAQVPIVQSISSLAAQTVKPGFRDKLARVAELVEEGNNFSEAISNFPDIFDTFFVSLIKSGEASGKLSESLSYISDHLERDYDIVAKIRGAMVYPLVILFAFVVVFIIVMTMVMPKLIDTLKGIGGQIPFTTTMLIAFYNFFIGYGWIVIIAFAALLVFLARYIRTKEGRKSFDKLILKIPFLKEFLGKIYLVRFCENLATLIMAGVPINRALNISKKTIGNYVYRKIVSKTEKGVSSGEKMSSILVKYPEFVEPFIIQMIKVGEQTGKLEKTLMEVVNFYQKEINRTLDSIEVLIEPVLILLLGVAVGILAISVIAPMYSSLNNIQ